MLVSGEGVVTLLPVATSPVASVEEPRVASMHGPVHIDVGGLPDWSATQHADGRWSIPVAGPTLSHLVYVTGTPAEIRAWAMRVIGATLFDCGSAAPATADGNSPDGIVRPVEARAL